MKKKLNKLAILFAAVGVVFFILTYFCFHYVTDSGITLEWHAEAGKPFVTLYLGVFATLNIFAAFAVAMYSAIVLKENEMT